MPQLTKTQTRLIAEMKKSSIKRTAVVSGYRTMRKNGGYGSRARAAAQQLVLLGLAKLVNQTFHRDCRSTYSDHWTEIVIELV